MAFFKIDENPEDWGRCRRDGKIVHFTNPKHLEKHITHKVESLDGFHVNELIRYYLGWL